MEMEEINGFTPISLEQMEAVRLMNRTDTKYWFHAETLAELFRAVKDDYYVLKMNDRFALPYSTIYFDNKENRMYTEHHNGKLNRVKIRRRCYVLSDISFLEVKFKNNKGRTIKKRMPGTFQSEEFSQDEQLFLSKLTQFPVNELTPSLKNNFNRITLVNKNFEERCTIDFQLAFAINGAPVSLNNLAIIEIKTNGSASKSPLAKALRGQRINQSGFSKYCIGRTITDRSLKRNAFKQKIRSIEKVIHQNNLYN